MAKSKKKAVWGWAPTKPKLNASSLNKEAIEAGFQEVLEQFQAKDCKAETHENDVSLGLYPISVEFKWYRNFLYITYNQRDAREGATLPYHEYKNVRIECTSNTTFNLAYFRHTEQWWTTAEGLNLEDAKKSILGDFWFQFPG
ncbi:MAG: hypothetical protein K1X92_02160 [Bacteroidia bacterium]|nr:hypothetical protein [Bacteroidia bacterium]